jgi:hypothetical protein
MIDSVGLLRAEDGVQDVDASPGQGDDGLMGPLALGSLAVLDDRFQGIRDSE